VPTDRPQNRQEWAALFGLRLPAVATADATVGRRTLPCRVSVVRGRDVDRAGNADTGAATPDRRRRLWLIILLIAWRVGRGAAFRD